MMFLTDKIVMLNLIKGPVMSLKFILFFAIAMIGGCASSLEQKFEGYFTYGHETSVFRQCNDSKYFWLNGESSERDVIDRASLELSEKVGEPYQAVYVVFAGYTEQREPVGFEEETDGLLYMTNLIDYSEEFPSNCM
jgi:hypothetical protein